MSRKFIKIGADIIDVDQIVSIEQSNGRGDIRLKNNSKYMVVYGNIEKAIELFIQLTEGEIYEAQ